MEKTEQAIRDYIKSAAGGYDIDDGTKIFIGKFREIYGSNLRAVIYYGSRLIEGMAKPSSFRDFFVIVEKYQPLARDWFDRLTLDFMPPKMWFLSLQIDGIKQDTKYHVVTLSDFKKYCSQNAPDHYVIGRMSKRVAVAWADEETTRVELLESIANAFIVNARSAVPLIAAPLSFKDAIKHFLQMSYRCELRLETPEKIGALYRTSKGYYDSLYGMLFELFVKEGVLLKSDEGYLPAASESGKAFRVKLYVIKSKARHIMRFPFMIKNMDNWLEQLLGKYERTYGKPLVLTESERRHKLTTAVKYFYKIKVAPKIFRGR